jgi:DNA-binding SARP family transcriptional activator
MTSLELRFLGGLSIHQAGRPLTSLKSQKGQALLCYLALTGKAHARPVLAGLLWPEMP